MIAVGRVALLSVEVAASSVTGTAAITNANDTVSASGTFTAASGTDKKISELDAASDVAVNDLIPIVDISDTTMAASGTNKKATLSTLLGWTEATIDFGTTPQWSKTFTITDARCLSSANVVLAMNSSETATGRVGNDTEWDQLLLACTAGSGSFTVTALATPGPVVGNRKIVYQIG